jgi:hypothetical protein
MVHKDASGVQGSERFPRPGGVYGFRPVGVPSARSLLVDAPPDWPELDIAVSVTARTDPVPDYYDRDRAMLKLRAGGTVTVERSSARASFALPERPKDGSLVHPHLASVAVVWAHWRGRESFHAGAFIAGGGAWGVLGDREAGKSSLLAALALAGTPILADDVLIVDGMTALAGPRSIDLRGDAARALGAGEPLGVVGNRERWRLTLEPADAEQPLRGWVSLGWDSGSKCTVAPLTGSDRLRTLGAHRGIKLYPPDPAALIELSALPFLVLRRPRRWERIGDAVDRLLDATG